MKSISKKVIKEENSEQRQVLIDNISQFGGIYKASKLMGVSIAKLVDLSGMQIDPEVAFEILYEKVYKDGWIQYKNFSIYAHDGLIGWERVIDKDNYAESINVYATPFNDGLKGIPIEIDLYHILDQHDNSVFQIDGDGNYYKNIYYAPDFKNSKDVIDWFENFYLPKVYSIVMDKLLPELYSKNQYKITKVIENLKEE
jgi:hypothetical protein